MLLADLGISILADAMVLMVSYPVVCKRMQAGGLTEPWRWLRRGETVACDMGKAPVFVILFSADSRPPVSTSTIQRTDTTGIYIHPLPRTIGAGNILFMSP